MCKFNRTLYNTPQLIQFARIAAEFNVRFIRYQYRVKVITFSIAAKYLLLRGVTALTRAVSGEKQIYSGNLEILPGIGKPGKFFGKYEIFSGH